MLDLLLRSISYGFGLYSLVYLIFLRKKASPEKPWIAPLDQLACALFAVAEIVLFAARLWVTYAAETGEHTLVQHPSLETTGYTYLLGSGIRLLVGQMFWVPKLRRNILFRALVGLMLVFSYQNWVILLTSSQREYLPMSVSEFLFKVFLLRLEQVGIFLLVLLPLAFLWHLWRRKKNSPTVPAHEP